MPGITAGTGSPTHVCAPPSVRCQLPAAWPALSLALTACAAVPGRHAGEGLARASSGEDDLAAGGEGVELADGDDALDLVDEVVLGQPEQVAGCLAAVDAAPVSAIISMNS